MRKSMIQSATVSLLLLTAAAGTSLAQSIKVPPVRRAAPVPAPVAPPVPVAVLAAHVAPAAAPVLPVLTCSATASSGVTGAAFSGLTMTATGGTAPYTVTGLPDGLTLDPTSGAVTGAPTTSGSFSAKVTDHAGAISATGCAITIVIPPGGLTATCPPVPAAGKSIEEHHFIGMAFNSLTVAGGATPYKFSSSNLPNNLTLDSTTGVISGAYTTGTLSNLNIKVTDNNSHYQSLACSYSIENPSGAKWLLPTIYMGSGSARTANINSFYNTDGKLSFISQIKSIYNGASNSATVSADLASLNFSAGWQVTLGTNIQAGASSPTAVSTGTVPTLSATSAAQATQNMLYGGTITATGIYPLLAAGAANLSSPSGVGLMIDFDVKEGVDIQNFKSGTSTNVNNPASHTSAQVEGYLQFNSTNLASGSTGLSAGAFFVGGSYGYNYMSHDYARDYGFGSHVNNGVGQVSVGFLINNVANIALSRAFGPSQTYIDSTTMASTTANYFKAWSFGITYQSAPATK